MKGGEEQWIRFILLLVVLSLIVYVAMTLLKDKTHSQEIKKMTEKQKKLKEKNKKNKRIGIRYEKTKNKEVNDMVTDINKALDKDMKNMCTMFKPGLSDLHISAGLNSALQKNQITRCSQLMSMAPTNLRPNLQKRVCGPNDTINERGVIKFVKDLNTAVCPY